MSSRKSAYGTPLLIRSERSESLIRIPLAKKDEGRFNEAWLQRLIHDYPECLPIDEIEPGFSPPVSVCMELPTRHGPIDNFLVTADGDIILVEAKLWKNPEARRKVIAQALDYASCLFEMRYEELEKAALKGDFGSQPKPERLFDVVVQGESIEESAFIDAVNANLRRGRIVILIAGDGIRSETEQLVDSLQSHAGFHFTLALVELAAFSLTGEEAVLVQPRTLARTCMIDRGIVIVDDHRVKVLEPETVAPDKTSTGSGKKTITAERFFADMDAQEAGLAQKIQRLLAEMEELGVYADYLGSLNLKWDPPEGKSVNMGYITKKGLVSTDASNWFVPVELSHPYNEELAKALEVEVDRKSKERSWSIKLDGKALRIEKISDKLNAWPPVVARFQDRIREFLARDEE
jgi:hypothetical protein